LKFEQVDIQALAEAVVARLEPLLKVNGRNDADDKWMTTKQTAEYMGMSVQWVHNHKHDLPHSNIGNKPLFRRSEIDTWIMRHRQNSEQIAATADKSLKESSFKLQGR